MLKEFLPANPCFWIFAEHLLDEIDQLERPSVIFRDDELSDLQLFEIFIDVAIFSTLVKKWVLSFERHPKQYDSQRKDIDLRVSLLLLRYLRRHINGCPFDRQILRNLWILDELRQSKISNLKVPIMYQNILRLDIPMHKCLFIEHFVPFTKLFQEKPDFFLCDVVLAIEHVLI